MALGVIAAIADAVLVASPCLWGAVDQDAFVQILRLELAASGTRSLEMTTEPASGAHVIEVVDCVEPGPTILVRAGRRAARIPLRDVGREARPRVLALASAELAADAWAEPEPEAPKPPPAPPALTATASPPQPERQGGWSWTGGVDVRIAPGRTGGALAGARFGVDRFYDRIGLHGGASLHYGRADNRDAGAVLADARLSLRGPALGRLRLDLEVGVESGGAWTGDVNGGGSSADGLIGGTAALAGRFRFSEKWDATLGVGYERVYTGDSTDLLCVSLEMSRSF